MYIIPNYIIIINIKESVQTLSLYLKERNACIRNNEEELT